MSPWLQQEVEALGYRPEQVFKTGVALKGSMMDCIDLNMQLRCASQVLYAIKEIKATNADELYHALYAMPWEQLLPADGYFSVSSNVSNSSISNNLFANVKVKDAIVDRFRNQTGSRPHSGAALNGAVIHLYWKEDDAVIYLDTSGETLSKHGYRKIPGKAPMLESLATATILASGWDGASPFINPMCGSGTLAIEAALLATHRKPGLYRRNYAFMPLLGSEHRVYQQKLQQLNAQIIAAPAGLTIIASDISEDAVQVSRVNAGIAGVEDIIAFELCDFEKTTVPPADKGAVFFNPEYGDRLGDEVALQATYKRMGDFLKQQCKGYKGYIFTGNLELAKKIGLKPKRRIEFFTSKIDCRLLEYELYAGSRETKN